MSKYSDQLKDTANGQSTKRCLLVCFTLEQNGQPGLEILFILYNKLFVHNVYDFIPKIASLIPFVTRNGNKYVKRLLLLSKPHAVSRLSEVGEGRFLLEISHL